MSAEHQNGELPEGWVETTMATAFDLNPRKVPADALPADAPVTFVPMPAVDAGSGTIASPDERPFGSVRKGYTSFIEDDVIVAKITPCMENGKVAIARGLTNRHGFGSTEFHVFRSIGAAIPEYVYHFVRQESIRSAAESQMRGAVGQKRVPPEFFESEPLPLPPLAEQKRIVAQVESLLAKVNAARERLAGVPAILRRFRQSVLAAACSGELTADWRDEHVAVDEDGDCLRKKAQEKHREYWEAAELKKLSAAGKPLKRDDWKSRYKAETELDIAEFSELPDTWAYCRTDELVEAGTVITYGIVLPGPNVEDGVPYVRGQDIDDDGNIASDDLARTTPEIAAKHSRSSLLEGDVLLCVIRNLRVAIVPPGLDGANLTQGTVRLRPSDVVSREYLAMYLASPYAQEWMKRRYVGLDMPRINVRDSREIPVPLPPLQEQQEIVHRVTSLFALSATITERLQTARKNTEALTNSILRSAFRGELVPNEAELARGEGRDYEPASVLLERIRAERDSATGEPARTRRTKAQRAAAAQQVKGIGFKRAAIAACFVDGLSNRPDFGRTVLEKAMYLTQTHVGVDLDLDFQRQAAGPFSTELIRVEHLAKKKGWFSWRKKQLPSGRSKIDYTPGPNIGNRLDAAREILGDKQPEMERLLNLFSRPTMKREQAEILGTVYAVWNDFLLGGRQPSDQEIIHGVREDWHKSKQQFEPERIQKCIDWMRREQFTPRGTGRPTAHPAAGRSTAKARPAKPSKDSVESASK